MPITKAEYIKFTIMPDAVFTASQLKTTTVSAGSAGW